MNHIDYNHDNDHVQVCLLGTNEIDRRRSCVSDGGFRLSVERYLTELCVSNIVLFFSLTFSKDDYFLNLLKFGR